jgi:hypothetical protein
MTFFKPSEYNSLVKFVRTLCLWEDSQQDQAQAQAPSKSNGKIVSGTVNHPRLLEEFMEIFWNYTALDLGSTIWSNTIVSTPAR